MKEYIQYLQDVLGIQKVILSDDEVSEIKDWFFTVQGAFKPTHKSHYELVFLNIVTQAKESLFLPEVRELFEKMKSAMRIKNIQYLELDCILDDRTQIPSEYAHLCESKYVVVLSSFPQDIGEFVLRGPSRWIETYSPAYLLEDPAAKKVVWNDLQKVMKELGL